MLSGLTLYSPRSPFPAAKRLVKGAEKFLGICLHHISSTNMVNMVIREF